MNLHHHLSTVHCQCLIAFSVLILLIRNYRKPVHRRIRLRVVAGFCVGVVLGLWQVIREIKLID
ncbi:hypothetical protein GO755_30565 [Spirosoma sp. HMF4905]|uniref:Uncharacterized protein n=1 Tax=Spirosoma arboris TaxID=2682092 RepID=A0A7K1SKX2_9BACT|nr:hypothetical protein [Spirosoma arboris]MVM34414.1 hypothetical protein [Spirosoma arboris]